MHLKTYCPCLLLCWFFSAFACANDDFKLSGFGSIGAVTTNSEQVGFRRDNADPEFTFDDDLNFSSLSSLGLQGNYRFFDNLEFVGQALLLDHPEQNADNILRIASLNYEPIPDLQIRFGRNAPRMFLLSDSRPVGYSYLWTMPVQEYYSLLTYNFVDGIDASYSFPLGPGYFQMHASYGSSTIYLSEPYRDTTNFELSDVMGADFEYAVNNWMIRMARYRTRPEGNLQTQEALVNGFRSLSQLLAWQEAQTLADDLDITNESIDFSSVAVTFNNGNIDFKAEHSRLESRSISIPNVKSSYLSLGKVINRYTPFIILGDVRSDPRALPNLSPPIATPEINQLIGVTSAILASGYDQQSVGLGFRVDLSVYSSLKLQWDRKWVGENGYNLWVPNESFQFPTGDERFDVISVRLDFILK